MQSPLTVALPAEVVILPHRIYMQKSCVFCAQETLTHCDKAIIFNDIRDLKKFTFFVHAMC